MTAKEGLAGLLLLAVQQDDAAIAKIFDGRVLKTLAAVGREFGVEIATVKEWRRNGMPGEQGSFPLAEVFVWKLRRIITMPQFTASSTGDTSQNDLDRKRAADARVAEANAEQKEQLNRIRAGNLLQRDAVEREMATVIIAARESLLRLPREMTPKFPRAVARELAEELGRLIEGKLRVLSRKRLSWETEEKDLESLVVNEVAK